MINQQEGWGGEERREAKRRYTLDRRLLERRKKYWSTLVLPVIIGVVATAIISWGAFVTHVTYGISAKYEQSFVKHVNDQLKQQAMQDHRLEVIKDEHSNQMRQLRVEMNNGFKEVRTFQHDIYSLLVKQQIKEEVKEEVEEEVKDKLKNGSKKEE